MAAIEERPKSVPTVQYRAMVMDTDAKPEMDMEKREATMSFSSEAPCRMYGIEEILDHQPQSIRMDRIRTAGPLLWNHNRDQQIGRLMDVRIENGKMRARVQFSKNPFAEEKWRDLQDGILRETSIGYRVYGAKLESSTQEVDTFRVTDWEPFEGSLVSIPADCSVGMGRSADTENNPPFTLPAAQNRSIEQTQISTMSEPTTATAPAPAVVVPNVTEIRDTTLQGERSRVSEINALASRMADKCPGVTDAARSHIADGKSVDDFRQWILVDGFKAKPATATSVPALPDMERDAKRTYSLCRVIASQDPELAKRTDLGFEREVSAELRKLSVGRTRRSDFTIPGEVLGIGLRDTIGPNGQRTMQSTTPSSGGYTVATDLQAGIIEKLDNMMVVGRLGVRRLTGLQGNVTIVRQTGGATAYWVAENAAITDSELTFDLMALTPHTVGATTPISKQLIVQSSSDVEAFVRADLQLRLALAEDLAFFQGTGGAQPLGIFNQPTATTEGTPEAGKTTKVTYGAAATFADAVGIIADLLEANVPIGSLRHVVSPATWGKWATKDVSTSTGVFMWQGTAESGTVGGYPGTVSNHLPSDRTVSAAWNNAIWAQWGGLDIVVDPYALKKQQALEVTVFDMLDFGFRHLEAFAVSTDSGAQ